MKKSAKILCAVLALVLALGCGVGGTLAWLSQKTAAVVNTFTYGDINIDLTEASKRDFKIIPGTEETKNPVVTVKADSEACWLFVKVDAVNMNLVTYSINKAGWTQGNGDTVPTNVYYREINAETAKTGVSYDLLEGNKVSYASTLTKTQIEEAKALNENPTLTFTAYAVQRTGFDDVNAAWAEAEKLG